jgi:signal peptidase I
MVAKADKKQDGIVETIKTVVYALAIALVFRSIFFQPFWIPSASMKDTLLIGDFLFVNKMAYGYSRYSCEVPFLKISLCPINGRVLGGEPQRGDVVVFRHPVNGQDFIKRLIGLPGDKVQVVDGVLYLNGEMAPQTPDGQFVETYEKQGPVGSLPKCTNPSPGLGADCFKDKFIETLPGGVSHSILNMGNGSLDNTPVYTVPDGNYFFMGDNRDDSTDSRVAPQGGGVGFVEEEFLIGRADRIMFSSAGRSLLFFWTWRPDRFFKAIE